MTFREKITEAALKGIVLGSIEADKKLRAAERTTEMLLAMAEEVTNDPSWEIRPTQLRIAAQLHKEGRT